MTPSFHTPLDLEYIDGRQWRIIKTFEYETYVQPQPLRITIPEGFVTDFASIPRVLWNLLPPTGSYGKAAVIHDAIYRTVEIPLSRGEADRVLLEAMGVLGTGWWTRHTIYAGVRVGGHWAYRERGL